MGRVKSKGIHLSGRVGDLIFYTRNGEDYVRLYPDYSRKKIPEGSKPAINMFTQTSLFYKFLPKELRLSWKIAAQKESFNGRNLFMSTNFHAFPAQGNIPYFERLQFSYGKLSLPRHMSIEGTEVAGKWKLCWESRDWVPFTSPFDHLYIVELHTNCPLSVNIVRKVTAVRSDNSCTFTVRTELGYETHLYCFFGNRNKTNFSICSYFCVNNPC